MNSYKTARLMEASTSFPEIIRPQNPAMEKRINRMIRETAEETLPEGRYRDMNIVTAASKYETTVNKNEILSIRMENYFYPENMANGITTVKGITVNLITGRKYRLRDLFSSQTNYQAYLDRIIKRQIEERDIPLLEEFPGITGNEVFYLNEEDLAIVYQRYDLAPGSYGVIEFSIPYQELEPIISEDSPIHLITGI